MAKENDWKMLHDATLVTITITWAHRHGQLLLASSTNPNGHVLVVIGGLRAFQMTQDYPWGPSVSINEVTVKTVVGGIRLCIEMQSGDMIQVTAEHIHIMPIASMPETKQP